MKAITRARLRYTHAMADGDDRVRLLEDLDAADAALVEALDRRTDAVRALAALQSEDVPVRLPELADVLERARERSGAFPPKALAPVLREVLGATNPLAARRRVLYLAPEGSFGHLAAREFYGAVGDYRAVGSAEELADAILRGRADLGLLPLETSSDGAVTATLEVLRGTEVKVIAEVTIEASFHLYSVTGNLRDVEKIYGHRGALVACEGVLTERFTRAPTIDVPSADVGVELVRQDHGAGLIGTRLLGELHGLTPVLEHCEDRREVFLRYGVVGTRIPARSGRDHTLLAFATSGDPGALYASLQPFAKRGLSLSRIESRPVRQLPWEHVFYVEVDGHITDRAVISAVDELKAASPFLKVLGSFAFSRE